MADTILFLEHGPTSKIPIKVIDNGDSTYSLRVATAAAGAAVHANPSVANATSVTILAANANRKYVRIQNNSAANIAISLAGLVMTGIVPTTAKPCIVLAAGATYENPAHFCPTGAITAYQTSGGAIETISVVSF